MPSLPTVSATYGYDSLNRLQSATDSGGWSRLWSYDQYGNMWVSGGNNIPGVQTATPQSNVFSGTNRMAATNYDASGNQTGIQHYALTYDAENRLTNVADTSTAGNNGAVQYYYDGEGRRVLKAFSDGSELVYVYDALGKLSAEYSNAGPAAPTCNTCYLTADYLGSTRMVTDASGRVVARHDYLPFGEEVGSNAGRDSSYGISDNINQKFTGQERDSETGLDFFNARFMSSLQGRFLSPDPFNAVPMRAIRNRGMGTRM